MLRIEFGGRASISIELYRAGLTMLFPRTGLVFFSFFQKATIFAALVSVRSSIRL